MSKTKELSGKCACGQVHYVISGSPLITQACHCEDCQRTTGSAFVIHTIVCEEDFSVAGEMRMGIGPTGSGAGCELHSCAQCGVLVWVRYRYHQVPVIAVRAGTLNDPSSVTPKAHIFLKNRLPWMLIPPETPCFEGGVTREEIWSRDSLERYNALPTRSSLRSN